MGFTVPYNPEKFEDFRQRSLNNWDWILELSESEVDTKIAEIAPEHVFDKPLFPHQKALFLLGLMQSTFNFFADPGAGKSALALNLIKYYQTKDPRPALFLCPDVANCDQIANECRKFTSSLKPISLIGSTKERLEQIKEPGDIYIINYTGLQHLLSISDSKDRSIHVNPDVVKSFAKDFGAVIYDEIYSCKNRQSITFQICKEISKLVPVRYGLTGTPINRDLLDLWGQFYLIDLGETLSPYITHYRQAFFKPKQERYGTRWIFQKKYTNDLFRLLKNKSIRYIVTGLPDKIHTKVPIELTPDAKKYYNQLRFELISDLQSDDWKLKTKSKFQKFRQICSGFLLVNDTSFDEETGEETGTETAEIVFENPKKKALEKLILSIPQDQKLIIFCEFTASGRRISNLLTTLSLDHIWYYGGTVDKVSTKQKFLDDPNCRFAVINPKSGGKGLNLQVANNVLYYEPPISGVDMIQGLRRAWRIGQQRITNIWHFVVNQSIEERVMTFLEEGANLFEQVIDGKIDASTVRTNFISMLNSKSDVLKTIGEIK